jgi:hypothetical protein
VNNEHNLLEGQVCIPNKGWWHSSGQIVVGQNPVNIFKIFSMAINLHLTSQKLTTKIIDHGHNYKLNPVDR